MKKMISILAVSLLLLGGCSDERGTAELSEDVGGTAPGGGDQTKKDAGSDKKDKAGGGRKSKGDGGGEDPFAGDKGDGDKAGGGSKSKSGGGSGSSGSTEAAATGRPAAGRYVYSQEGFEEFCQTTCDRSDLPPEQDVSVKVDGNTVVSEVKASHSRIVRTTYEFSDEKALIKEVYTKVNYQNVQMEDTYRPDPPVEALRFPLRSGMSWSGKWKAKTSGDYSIAITRKESVEVGGRTIEAFRIETETHFRGQFEGKSVGVVWIDPDTSLPVKAEGTVDVKSAFGRYHSEASTLLKSGPGY